MCYGKVTLRAGYLLAHDVLSKHLQEGTFFRLQLAILKAGRVWSRGTVVHVPIATIIDTKHYNINNNES